MPVVVIDDSLSSLTMLAKLVRSMHIGRCHAFDDPAKASSVLGFLNAGIVLVDYEMPQMDGVSFIRWMRGVPELVDVPVIMITGNRNRDVMHAALEAGANDFIHKPIDPEELKPRVQNLLKLRQAQVELRERANWLAAEVAAATDVIRRQEREIIFRLARAVEFRDTETGAHIWRMAAYSGLIARELGLPGRDCDILELAAPLHDIGKIAIRDSILLKSGALTAEERADMQQHTNYGHHVLNESSSLVLQVAAEIAWCHHERWDGKGYPRGLSTETIPLVARIVAVADVFDALTTVRPYKEAWPVDKARDFLRDNSGSQFDPDCVEAFLRRWEEVLTIAAKASFATGAT